MAKFRDSSFDIINWNYYYDGFMVKQSFIEVYT